MVIALASELGRSLIRNLPLAHRWGESTAASPWLRFRSLGALRYRLERAMGVGKGRRLDHLAADNFDIGPGFAGAGRRHRFIKLAKRGHARGKPVGTTERLRQSGVGAVM
jgi:hypothetical protein